MHSLGPTIASQAQIVTINERVHARFQWHMRSHDRTRCVQASVPTFAPPEASVPTTAPAILARPGWPVTPNVSARAPGRGDSAPAPDSRYSGYKAGQINMSSTAVWKLKVTLPATASQ